MNSGISGLTGPTVDPEPERLGMPAKRKGSSRRARPSAGLRAWVRRGVLLLVVLALLPVVLTILYLPPFVHPVSTQMVKDLATFQGYHRQWVSIDEVAPVLVHSVIMSEDGQFCAHRGIDWAELNLVIDDAMAGEVIRGASTVTMQTVKNLYLWHRPLVTARKIVELPLAVYLDLVLSKRRIMEIYLNIAEWGPGIYGAEAAAQYHFGRSAKNLSRRQAALLAVALPNPIERNPAKPGPGLRRIASVIERRALRAGGYVGCVD
jgi:monofunctional biosynthetic peptidoglycan transglycosylase